MLCSQCGHPFDPHLVSATVFATINGLDGIPAGGYIECQEPGCSCRMTWSLTEDIAGFDAKAAVRAAEN